MRLQEASSATRKVGAKIEEKLVEAEQDIV